MKRLDFKKLKLLYLNLLTIVILLPSFGGAGGGLYAQDPQLFEHTWYFVNGEFDGQEFFPLTYLQGELIFSNDDINVFHNFCEEGGIGSIVEYQNDLFILENFEVVLIGVCGEPDEELFMHKHYSIYGDYQDTGEANNPFSYTIEPVNDYLQLTITNSEGDWAVYNSVLLSTPTFDQNSFAMYPNPVKENLSINNTSNQSVAATIYDVSGNALKKQLLVANTSIINVKSLNTGLYFVVFENERGERVSKKFVKN